MLVQRFHDEVTQTYSYLVLDEKEAIAIDPGRNVVAYLDYLLEHHAKLKAIFLTHCPASLASGWAELRERTGAVLYGAADYGFHGPGEFIKVERATQFNFGEGYTIQGQLTPGFAPDSCCYLLSNGDAEVEGIFTGGSMLNEGAGYPLPRPGDVNPLNGDRTYAKELYATAHDTIKGFNTKASMYTGYGGEAHYVKTQDKSHVRFNLNEELDENPIYTSQDANAFADWLLKDKPFVPAYYYQNLEKNLTGYPHYKPSVAALAPADAPLPLGNDVLIIDTRRGEDFMAGHARHAINIQLNGPFPLWIGTIVRPGEPFVLLVDTVEHAEEAVGTVVKIGYDLNCESTHFYTGGLNETKVALPPLERLEDYPNQYTIVDVRPEKIAKEDTRFHGALNFPLETLRDRWGEIPVDRPIVVHCGGGYHSAIGSSVLRRMITETPVYDLGSDIDKFKPA